MALYNFYTGAFSKFTLNTRSKHDRIQQRLAFARARSPRLVAALADHCLASGRIARLWREIAAVRKSFVDVYPHVQPFVQMQYWKKQNQDFTKFSLSAKKFNELRQLYIDAFETLSRLLTLIVGIEAIIHHGELAVPTKKGKMSLDEFEVLANANKVGFVERYPIEDLFVPVLDADFRNRIGHHSAHYDASTDEVIAYPSKKAGGVARKMRYTDFVHKVLALFAVFELAAIYHHDLHIGLNGRFS